MPAVTDEATDLNAFHRILSRYINTGCMSSRDKYASLFSKRMPYRANASYVINIYERVSAMTGPAGQRKQVFDIPLYAGTNKYVHLMMEYLDEKLDGYLSGAYVHGSLGSYDEMEYSDFDATVILSDKAFRSETDLARVAILLSDARRIMIAYDPLQHHGWFTLANFSLSAYPCAYFPPELFAYSKSLLPDVGRKLEIIPRSGINEYKDSFRVFSGHLVEQLSSSVRPRNIYQLKSLLSEFMLLPACYVQARDAAGIYKKFSFDSASRDFPVKDWAIMNEVSDIRSRWHFRLGKLHRWFITRNTVTGYRITQRFAPEIPGDIKKVLSAEFYGRMLALVCVMRKSIMAE